MSATGPIPIQDEDEARPFITHARDLVVEDGVWEQDYHFLDYDFSPSPWRARAYFDEDARVIVWHEDEAMPAPGLDDLPGAVRVYLQYRFDRIEVVVGSARQAIWIRGGPG